MSSQAVSLAEVDRFKFRLIGFFLVPGFIELLGRIVFILDKRYLMHFECICE